MDKIMQIEKSEAQKNSDIEAILSRFTEDG